MSKAQSVASQPVGRERVSPGTVLHWYALRIYSGIQPKTFIKVDLTETLIYCSSNICAGWAAGRRRWGDGGGGGGVGPARLFAAFCSANFVVFI